MYSNSLLEHILTLPGNDKCLECGSAEPKWASFPTAIFLCFKCARTHKKFSHPQTIKSLEVADFTKHEISLLSLGGNFRFTSLMNEYSISLNEPNPEHKYQTIISTYYCTLLEAEVNKLENVPGADKKCQDLLAQRPIYEVGGELNTDGKVVFGVESDSNVNPSPISNQENEPAEKAKEENNNEQPQQNSGWGLGGFFSFVGSAIHKTAQYAGVDEGLTNMQNKLNENLEYYGVNKFVKDSSEKVSGMAKSTSNYIYDKGSQLYQNNQLVHNTFDIVSTGASVIKDKSLQLAQGAIDAAQNFVNSNNAPHNNEQPLIAKNTNEQAEPKNVAEQLKDDGINKI